MRKVKAFERAIAAATPYVVLLVALAVGLEAATVSVTGRLDTPGPIGAIARVAETVHLGVTNQADRLDSAICDVLTQLEYACTRGFV
jgi:hypothetical protein